MIAENNKKKKEPENSHKKHSRDFDKYYKNDKKEVENKSKSDREEYHKKDSKSDNSKNSRKDKITEESHKSKSNKDIYESKKQDHSPIYKTPVKERGRDKERDKYSYRQKERENSKSNKDKSEKKSDRTDSKYSSKKKNESPVKELKKPIIQNEKLTCISSDSDKSCYTPPPKDMNVKYAKSNQSKSNEEKNVKSTKYTFSLREGSEDNLVVSKTNGQTDPNLKDKSTLNNSEYQHKKTESQKSNDRIDKVILDSSSSEVGDLEDDIDLNIIKEITTEKIKKVFELHEKQEQALLHLKKKLMEKKLKVRTSSSSDSSDAEPVKKKSVKRRHVRDSSSSVRCVKYFPNLFFIYENILYYKIFIKLNHIFDFKLLIIILT